MNTGTQALKVITMVGLVYAVTACSVIGIKNDNVSYLSAADAPNLVDPLGVTPISRAMYELPVAPPSDATTPPAPKIVAKGSFKMPLPAELNRAELTTSAASAVVTASVGKPGEPRILADKNGVPNLKVDGDEALIKAQLLRALGRANISTVDASLLNVGKLTINSNGASYTLRLNHTGLSSLLVLQDRNGLLAAPSVARSIFESIILFWKDPAA